MEDSIYEGRKSLRSYWLVIVFASFFVLFGLLFLIVPDTRGNGVFFLVFGLLWFGGAYLGIYATHYTISSQRVIQRNGLIKKHQRQQQLQEAATLMPWLHSLRCYSRGDLLLLGQTMWNELLRGADEVEIDEELVPALLRPLQ